ncbi:hypothetical protein EJB05_53547, partial [Eragrostis curvula]
MEIEKLFPRSFCTSKYVIPYFMAWPPSLVGNYGSFARWQTDFTPLIATMFHGRASTRPLVMKSPNQSYPTTIGALGQDRLLEIFLSFPSLVTVIRVNVTVGQVASATIPLKFCRDPRWR